MVYAIIENEKIKGIFDGAELPKNGVEVPDYFSAEQNENINHFNKDWTRKSLQQLVDEGIENIPEGMKIENNQFVKMSEVEKINAGLEELPEGKKIENDMIIDMSLEEKLEKGLITENDKEWKDWKISEHQSYLSSTDWYAIRFADEGVAIPEDIKAKRQEAREEISRLRDE